MNVCEFAHSLSWRTMLRVALNEDGSLDVGKTSFLQTTCYERASLSEYMAHRTSQNFESTLILALL